MYSNRKRASGFKLYMQFQRSKIKWMILGRNTNNNATMDSQLNCASNRYLKVTIYHSTIKHYHPTKINKINVQNLISLFNSSFVRDY